MSAHYRDLPAELTRKSTLILCYAVGAVLVTYVGGVFSSTLTIFLLLEVPLALAATWVLMDDPDLQYRVPVLWTITGVFAIGLLLNRPVSVTGSSLIVLSLLGMIGYWISLVVASFLENYRHGDEFGRGQALATLGAALMALGVLLSVLVRLLTSNIEQVRLGRMLIALSELWVSLIPIRILLLGLTAIGLIWNAAALFRDRPYRAPTPDSVMPVRGDSLLSVLITVVRWPIWISLVIVGYALRFAEHVLIAGADWFRQMAAQVAFAATSMLGGPTTLVLGHLLIVSAGRGLEAHLLGTHPGLVGNTVDFVGTHLVILIGLSLYAIAPALIGVRFHSDEAVFAGILKYIRLEGFPACISVGRAFALLGILLIAMPIANAIPGGKPFGVFSAIYLLLLCSAIFYYYSLSRGTAAGPLTFVRRRPAVDTSSVRRG